MENERCNFKQIATDGIGFLLFRYIKRGKHRRRMLHTGKAPGDTGFNEALSYTVDDAHRFY